MRRFVQLLVIVALTIAAAALPATAGTRIGTPAWSTDALLLRSGPGGQYAITGQIDGKLAINVLRCQKLWCEVKGEGGHGWTSRQFISFGRTPSRWPGGVNPNYASGGPGTVCFYQGINYTGAEYCIPHGRTIVDLALTWLDNTFSSVRIEGNISVSACRDRNFQSYCERITTSQPALNTFLRRNLSSFRIH